MRNASVGNMGKNSLDRYKKKPSSQNKAQAKNNEQQKKVKIDSNNVFYQDRQTLRLLELTNRMSKILLPVFFAVVISYFLIYQIKPYQGKCPENATCKVYVRCHPGYEYDQYRNQCIVQASIIEEIQNVCKVEIQELKLKYGDQDCANNTSGEERLVPYKTFNELVNQITRTQRNQQFKVQIQRRMGLFLHNYTNQAQYEFSFIDNRVIPLKKSHSFTCWVQLISQTQQAQIFLVVAILVIIISVYFFINYKKHKRANDIYQYLKEKVLLEDKANITLLKDELRSIFGKLDDSDWVLIEEERKKDGKIGYFEDQFLFWRVI